MPIPPFLEDPEEELYSVYGEWQEYAEANDPSGDAAFSLDSGSDVLICNLSDYKRLAFLRAVLGYAYTDNTYRLYRELPLRHPYYNWLYARNVSFNRRGLAGNPRPPVNGEFPYYLTRESTGSVPYHAYYEQCLASVEFTNVPYRIFPDGIVTDESDRFVDYAHDVSPEVSQISAKTGRVMTFVEGVAGATGSPLGKTFPSELFEYLCKTAVAWKWYFVPEEYLFREGSAVPRFVEVCVGRVNEGSFGRCNAVGGTLLLAGCRLEKFQWPWNAAQLGGDVFIPSFGYHVTLVFSHFDPTPAVEDPVVRGHNLLPWSVYVQGANSVWYSAVRSAPLPPPPPPGSPPSPPPPVPPTTNPKLVPSADFRKIFQHCEGY